jgi:hypothetical protein
MRAKRHLRTCAGVSSVGYEVRHRAFLSVLYGGVSNCRWERVGKKHKEVTWAVAFLPFCSMSYIRMCVLDCGGKCSIS